MIRVALSIGNIVFAFFLGALALAAVFIQFPDLFQTIYTYASQVKQYFVAQDMPIQYKNLLNILIEEASLVFMFFVILARIVLSLLLWIFSSLFRTS